MRVDILLAVAREAEFLAENQRRHVFELYAVADVFRFEAVDFVHAHQRKYFSPSFGGRIAPLTVSPGLSPKSLICDGRHRCRPGN